MDRRRRMTDGGAIVLGLLLLIVGAWYMLDQTFGMALPDVEWDQIWPVALVLLGIGVLYRALRSRESAGPTDSGTAATR